MTLTLVALAAVVTVGLSRAAMQRVVVARQAVEDLQHRWGVISCRRAVLPQAERVLAFHEARVSSPKKRVAVTRVTRTVLLGTERLEVTVADEQAKPNVNLLLRTLGEKNAEQAIRKRLSGTGVNNAVSLRATAGNPWPIGSFGQVFRTITPEKLSEVVRGQAVRGLLTCWGSGRINLMRADDKALNLILAPEVSTAQVRRMILQRDASPMFGLGDALQALQLTSEAQGKVTEKLTARSRCHSVWITGDTGRRTWHHLTVMHEGPEPQLTRYHTTVW